jgi:hypothetical protein
MFRIQEFLFQFKHIRKRTHELKNSGTFPVIVFRSSVLEYSYKKRQMLMEPVSSVTTCPLTITNGTNEVRIVWGE